MYICSYLSEFFLEWEMFHKKDVGKTKTHILWSKKKKFSEKKKYIYIYIGLHVKYPLFFFSDFNVTWTLSPDLRKFIQYRVSWKSILSAPSCFMWTDRQTDMTKLKVAFRSFCERAWELLGRILAGAASRMTRSFIAFGLVHIEWLDQKCYAFYELRFALVLRWRSFGEWPVTLFTVGIITCATFWSTFHFFILHTLPELQRIIVTPSAFSYLSLTFHLSFVTYGFDSASNRNE